MKERYQQVVNKGGFINNLLISFFICLHERRLARVKKENQAIVCKPPRKSGWWFILFCL